eukprot:2939631-Prymnesium_polylepis.1
MGSKRFRLTTGDRPERRCRRGIEAPVTGFSRRLIGQPQGLSPCSVLDVACCEGDPQLLLRGGAPAEGPLTILCTMLLRIGIPHNSAPHNEARMCLHTERHLQKVRLRNSCNGRSHLDWQRLLVRRRPFADARGGENK